MSPFSPPAFSWERGHLGRHFCGQDAALPGGVSGYKNLVQV